MTETELQRLRPPPPPVRVRVRADGSALRVLLVGRDCFELSGRVSPARSPLRPRLAVQVDEHRVGVELSPGMTARQTALALARALPDEYVLRARQLPHGLAVVVVRAPDAWRPAPWTLLPTSLPATATSR